MIVFFFAGLVYLICILVFLFVFIRSYLKGEKQVKGVGPAIILYFSEIMFTVVGPVIGFMRFDEYGPETPFAKEHVLTVILFVMVSSLSFWVARFTSKTENPVLRILVSVGLLQGIILCFLTTIHFTAFLPLAVFYPFLGFELLSPLFAFLILLKEFHSYNTVEFNYDDAFPYREELGFIPLPIRILRSPLSVRVSIYGGLLLILVVVQCLMAFGCGQEIDSLIKAYRHSIGFVFSR